MRTRAYWTDAAGHGSLRSEDLPSPRPDEVLVRTLASGVSRGTELLVQRRQVPPEVAEQMRAPFQEGAFDADVKYGYLAVGVVEAGPDELVGRRVFCLHPHQERFVVPADAVTPLPDAVPTERAVLAGTVETAVNALWDAGVRIGDRVAVVGAGMVGLSVALLVRRHPVGRLQVVEADPHRRDAVAALGFEAVSPEAAEADCDIVFHASASAAGLNRGLELLGEEGVLVELSWYGTRHADVALGTAFHARRLRILASQVSRVSDARRARRSPRDRMAVALDALRDDAWDALLGPPADFADLPRVMSELDSGARSPWCQLIRYPQEETDVSPDRA